MTELREKGLKLFGEIMGAKAEAEMRSGVAQDGFGYSRRQFGAPHPHHPALNDRVLDPQKPGQPRLQSH